MSKHGGHRRRGSSTPVQPEQPEQPALSLPSPPTPPPAPPAGLPPAPMAPAAPPADASAEGRGSVSTLAPITTAPPVVARPVPSLVPTGRGQRKAAQRDERRKGLRKYSVVGGILLALAALIGGIVVTGGGGATKNATVPTAGTRTQHTILLSLAPSGGQALDSALLAHDSANGGQGVVVLVPANVVADVAGRGSMLLGAAAAFGPQVTAATLSDLISVTVDGSWVLTPEALAALVDHLGGITASLPTDILSNGQVVVSKGDSQLLTGAQAVAIAEYSAPEEPSLGRLSRLQTVLTGILDKLGTDPKAVSTVLAGLATGSSMGTSAPVIGQVLASLELDRKSENVAYTTLPTTVLDTGDQTERLSTDGVQVAAVVKQYFSGTTGDRRSHIRTRGAGYFRVIIRMPAMIRTAAVAAAMAGNP